MRRSWYQVLGNHDHFWLGSVSVDHGRAGSPRLLCLRRDCSRPATTSPIPGSADGLHGACSTAPKPLGDVIPASPPISTLRREGRGRSDRRSLTRSRMDEGVHHDDERASRPRLRRGGGRRTSPATDFVPKSDVPIKIIAPTTPSSTTIGRSTSGHSFLDARAVGLAQEGTGRRRRRGSQLMIIAAHSIGDRADGAAIRRWAGGWIRRTR